MSISLNIAEGNGRWHSKERKNFFLIAGGAFEWVPLLELCCRKKWITDDYSKEVKEELEILARMLSALIRGTYEKREY